MVVMEREDNYGRSYLDLTELIMLIANSLNLVGKFTEFTDQFH
jgi:hypothetical protein